MKSSAFAGHQNIINIFQVNKDRKLWVLLLHGAENDNLVFEYAADRTYMKFF